MPRVIVIEAAQNDIARLESFLKSKNREAARHLKFLIKDALSRLTLSPYLGSPFFEPYRRLIIRFGRSAYILYYVVDETLDELYVLALQHGREDLNHPEHGQYSDSN